MKVRTPCGGRHNIERGDVAIPSSVGRRCGKPKAARRVRPLSNYYDINYIKTLFWQSIMFPAPQYQLRQYSNKFSKEERELICKT